MDEFGFVFEVWMLLAGVEEGYEVESLVVHYLVDDVFGVFVV